VNYDVRFAKEKDFFSGAFFERRLKVLPKATNLARNLHEQQTLRTLQKKGSSAKEMLEVVEKMLR
jgi:hypothetical protein